MLELKERQYKRNYYIDAIKGVLIFLVVLAHYKVDVIHDIIFLFHMPLFFIISGFLTSREKLLSERYIRRKVIKLIIPYSIYMIFNPILILRIHSPKDALMLIYGGRAISGVYWYITSYLFAVAIIKFIDTLKIDSIHKYAIILVGGGYSGS